MNKKNKYYKVLIQEVVKQDLMDNILISQTIVYIVIQT